MLRRIKKRDRINSVLLKALILFFSIVFYKPHWMISFLFRKGEDLSNLERRQLEKEIGKMIEDFLSINNRRKRREKEDLIYLIYIRRKKTMRKRREKERRRQWKKMKRRELLNQ